MSQYNDDERDARRDENWMRTYNYMTSDEGHEQAKQVQSRIDARSRSNGGLIAGIIIFVVLLIVGISVSSFFMKGGSPNTTATPTASVCVAQALPNSQLEATVDATNPFSATITVDASSTTCGLVLQLHANGKINKTQKLPYIKGAVNAGQFKYNGTTLNLWACIDPGLQNLFYNNSNNHPFEGLNPGDSLLTC